MQYAVFTNIQCREGHDYNSLYRGRIEETEWAEKLGFDAVFFAEHALLVATVNFPFVTTQNFSLWACR